jgi:hypothetical protein
MAPEDRAMPDRRAAASGPHTEPSWQAPNSRKSGPPPVIDGDVEPLTDDDVDDLVEQISKCGTAGAVKALSEKHKARLAVTDDEKRARLTRVSKEQLSMIRAADAAEKSRAS